MYFDASKLVGENTLPQCHVFTLLFTVVPLAHRLGGHVNKGKWKSLISESN